MSTRTVTLNFEPYALAFSEEGLTVAVAGVLRQDQGSMCQSKFVLWDIMTGGLAEHDGSEIELPIGKSSISPDLKAAAFPRGYVVALVTIPERGMKPSKRLLRGHKQVVGGATFSPDSRIVATACVESIRIWDVATGECKLFIPTGFHGCSEAPPAPVISRDGCTVAARFRRLTFSEHYVGLWSTETGMKRKEFAKNLSISDFAGAFSPDGESFSLLSKEEGSHVVFTTWDTLGTNDSDYTNRPETRPPAAIDFSEAKQAVAIAFTDGSFELWNAPTEDDTATQILFWQESSDSGFAPVNKLCFSTNGKRLAYEKSVSSRRSDKEGNIRVRDTETGAALPSTAWDDGDMAGIQIQIGFWDEGRHRLSQERPTQALPITVPVTGSWLCLNSEPILLLPSQCQLQATGFQNRPFAADGNAIALAFASGKFSVLRLHQSKMQTFLGQQCFAPLLSLPSPSVTYATALHSRSTGEPEDLRRGSDIMWLSQTVVGSSKPISQNILIRRSRF
jgi:WD40 repeat protein